MPLVIKPTGIQNKPITTVEILSKRFIIKDNGCWDWIGYKNKSGYGQFSVSGYSRNAHRIMWELTGRKVDYSKQLDHLCRNRSCVNPNHLRQVTAKENTHGSLALTYLNHLKTHCASGHEYTAENIYIPPSKRQRVCRECQRHWSIQNYRKLRKAELQEKNK